MDAIESDISALEELRDTIQNYADQINNIQDVMHDCVNEAESIAGSVDV